MIVSRNYGLIDLRAIRTFGISAKVGDNPIGQFGSGSKYLIAIALRTGHEVTLLRGAERYTFHTQPVFSRDKQFAAVVMRGPEGETEMPFTLDLGKTWEVWQAYREMHSNALDEGGQTFLVSDSEFATYQVEPNETAFLIKGPEMESAHAARATIFLGSPPLFVSQNDIYNHHVQVHPGRSDHVYYRGVRAMTLKHPSLYTYNVLSLPDGLTEDRTVKNSYQVDAAVGRTICWCSDRDYLKQAMLAQEGTYEYALYGGWATTPNASFLEVYSTLRAEGHIADMTSLADQAYLMVNRNLPLPEPLTLNKIQTKQLERAKAFCTKAGWSIDYPIKVVPHAHGGLLALVEGNTIVLTQGLFDQGTHAVVHGLLEEQLHLKHGFKDMTREFQTFLFRQLIGMAEQVVGEPI